MEQFHAMSWFSKQSVEAEIAPAETAEQRRAHLPRLIEAATKELADAARDQSRYRMTHRGHEKIIGLQFQVALNAMKQDVADTEIQKRARRLAEAKQAFHALNRENALAKNPGLVL